MKRTFLFFVLVLLISNIFSTQIQAQYDDSLGSDSSNNFLPSASGASNTVLEDTNVYLQGNTETENKKVALKPRIESGKLACPYVFERDLQVGSTGEDVKLLQILLNSDKRTMIAVNGPGSLGKETNSFGEATKVALKKFQALFIEYVGVANGRFGPRTRTVINAICNGDTSSSKKEAVYDNVQSVQKNATPQGEITEIPNDRVAPRVSLSANLNTINIGDSFKVVVNFSEEVKPITPDSVIVDGGVVKEIRKLSKTSYAIAITPSENVKTIVVQVEADKIEDLAGNKNENASNEITVKVKIPITPINNATNTPDNASLDSLVNKVISSAPSCNYDNQGNLITNNPNNGQPINTTGCNPTKTTYAAYNSQMRCYADNGPLPTGISEVQRCSNPQNPNNPNSPCSAQNQAIYQQQLMTYQQQQNYYNGYFGSYGGGYGYPTNPCQNSQIAYGTQQAAQQAAQQNAQNGQIGQLLGSLLGKNGLGSLGVNNKGNGGGDGGGNTSRQDGGTYEQAKKEQVQNDLQALTDQYAKECNTNEKLSSKVCKDIEKKVAELSQPEKTPNKKDLNLKEQCNINGAIQSGQSCLDSKNGQLQAGQVSEDPKETAKECPYLFYPEKKTYKSLKGAILEISSIPENKKYIFFTENPWNYYQDVKKDEYFIKKTSSITSLEQGAICCKSTTRVKGSIFSSSAEYSCTTPSSKKDLKIYKINTNKKDEVRFQTDKP